MVSERRQEFAVRAALGASPAHTLRAVMTEGMIVAAVGIALGTLATIGAGDVLRSVLFGVRPDDPATLGLVGLLVGTGALIVCYLPARRDAAANPLDLLRNN
jgi:ABC-type antimicrobial peptide transport system permease subunit